MSLEERVDNIEKRVSQNEKNILYIYRKSEVIQKGLENVETSFINLKNQLDNIDSNAPQDQSYDIDISTGSVSFKNPKLEFFFTLGFMIMLWFLIKSF